jgi:hypothetical protein
MFDVLSERGFLYELPLWNDKDQKLGFVGTFRDDNGYYYQTRAFEESEYSGKKWRARIQAERFFGSLYDCVVRTGGN